MYNHKTVTFDTRMHTHTHIYIIHTLQIYVMNELALYYQTTRIIN